MRNENIDNIKNIKNIPSDSWGENERDDQQK